MTVRAILAMLVVGSVSVAAAQPTRQSLDPKRGENGGRVSLDEKKKKKPQKRKVVERKPGDWFEIADATPAKHGTEFVFVSKDVGYVKQLRLDAVAGKVIVRRVKVHFVDGSAKVFPVNRTIDARRQPSTFVELGAGKRLERVIVTTEPHTDGEYTISGASTTPPADATCC